MMPILLISDNKKSINKYINSYLLGAGDLFFELAPEGTKYLLPQIKEVVRETFIFNPKKRVYFFPDFHVSSIEAQNAFLKGLEETPDNVLFVLSADSVSKLLPTVVSRMKIVNLAKKSDFKPSLGIQKQLDRVLSKKNFSGFELRAFEIKGKEEAAATIDQIVFFFRGRLSHDVKAAPILKEIIRQKSLVENNNLTPQLAVDHILIFIAKSYNMKI